MCAFLSVPDNAGCEAGTGTILEMMPAEPSEPAVDCRLSGEEFALVSQWQASGRPFHVVRDHPLHDDLMLAGLWGGTGSDTLRMRDLIAAYFNGRPTAKYGRDQTFLGAAVWPGIRPLVHVHDRYYETDGVASHRHTLGLEFGKGHQNAARVLAEAAALGIVA